MRASFAFAGAGAVALGCLSSGAAVAQICAGGEFQVNTYTTGNQPGAHISSLGGGGFVVVWESVAQAGIFGRRYDAAGSPLAGEFQVDGSTTTFERSPSVAGYGAGRFIVTWSEGFAAVMGRRFDTAGNPAGGPFVAATPSGQFNAIYNGRVAAAANGAFVAGLAYSGPGGPWDTGCESKLFDASGSAICTASCGGDDTTMMPDGGFVGAGTHILPVGPSTTAQRVDATCQGPFLPLNTNPALWAWSPGVAANSDGNIVVAWARGPASLAPDTIVARRFDALGAPLGAEFQVSTYTTSFKTAPKVGMAGDGSFQVAWMGAAQDGSSYGVLARRFRPDGTPREGEFQVNTYTTGAQTSPRVASDANGNFVVAWQSAGQDGSYTGVFAQRFGGIRAAALDLDDGGNDVLEAGETATVSPSWRNVNGAAQTFGGSATSFTGPGAPGDPTYTLSDAVASYGTVANGATASCTGTGDCYQVALSVPTSRPAPHWDARLIEELTPGQFGQSQVWLFHVGGSFSDMPDTNPFYRFVETLLHRGVTSGCAAGQYCGAGSTTREQMAVFALTAKEGAGYAAPGCGTPVFSDVPASSPFCRWIEELARRGVVSGCGGGRYCPQDAVSREQMAIFMLRTLDPALNPTACTIPMFGDVPATSPFCRWIEELARRGVVSGCGGGNYCPAQPVTREQMGVFIAVTFGLTLYGP